MDDESQWEASEGAWRAHQEEMAEKAARETGALLPDELGTFVVTRTWRVRAESATAAIEAAIPGTHSEVTAQYLGRHVPGDAEAASEA